MIKDKILYRGFEENTSPISEWGRKIVKCKKNFMIVDNFLRPKDFQLIKEKVTSEKQIWYFTKEVSVSTGRESNSIGTKKSYGMSFTYITTSQENYCDDRNSFPYVHALNKQISKFCKFDEGTKVVRTRLDMTTYRGEESFTFSPHIDLNIPHLTSIFYFHTTNAPTILFNEIQYDQNNIDENKLTVMEEVECVENRLLVFYGNHIHTGKCLTDNPVRVLLNTNFDIPSISLSNYFSV